MVTLNEVRELIRKNGRISLVELANELRTRKELIEPLCELLVKKGYAETWVPSASGGCGCGCSCGCSGQNQNPVRFYRWAGD